jgi:hypothetical protein
MFKTREEWLTAAMAKLTPMVEAKCGRTMPPTTVTVGWPSAGGLARKKPVIGQCWDGACSADGSSAIFISPVLDAGGEYGALATLVHEMLHALVGVECKHKGPFAKAAKACGLEGKPTATFAGAELLEALANIQGVLGEYPHARITPAMKEKSQGTRMIKCECEACGYVCRTTRKWLENVGAPWCACNGEPMDIEGAIAAEEPRPEDDSAESEEIDEEAIAAEEAHEAAKSIEGDLADDEEFDAEEDAKIIKARFCFGCMEGYTGKAGGCSPKCREALAVED